MLLESPDEDGHAVVTRAVAVVKQTLPDDPSELAVGLDGSLWAAGGTKDALWFQRPTSGSGPSDASR